MIKNIVIAAIIIAAPSFTLAESMGAIAEIKQFAVDNRIVSRGARVVPVANYSESASREPLYPAARKTIAKYGFDIFRSEDQMIELRGGISKLSTKADAGVELTIRW